jgi:hypothetical protein
MIPRTKSATGDSRDLELHRLDAAETLWYEIAFFARYSALKESHGWYSACSRSSTRRYSETFSVSTANVTTE